MRRLPAMLLLAVFSLGLITPALIADLQTQLPACCRRLGEHHCTMQEGNQQSSGETAKPAPARCPAFPGTPGKFIPGSDSMGLGTVRTGAIVLPVRSAGKIQPVSLDLTRVREFHHKRGPPSFSQS